MFLFRKAQHGLFALILLIRTFDKQPAGLSSSIPASCDAAQWGAVSCHSCWGHQGVAQVARLQWQLCYPAPPGPSPPQTQIKPGQPRARESTWLSPVPCQKLLRARCSSDVPALGREQQREISALWSPSHPSSKGHSGFPVSLFPNVCGSSDSPPCASQPAVVGNCHRAQLCLACSQGINNLCQSVVNKSFLPADYLHSVDFIFWKQLLGINPALETVLLYFSRWGSEFEWKEVNSNSSFFF